MAAMSRLLPPWWFYHFSSFNASLWGNVLSSFTSSKIFASPIWVGFNQRYTSKHWLTIHDAIHLIPLIKYNWSRIFLSINQAGIGVISGRVIFAAGAQSETNIKQLSICQRPLCVIHLWVDLLGMWNRYEWRYSYFPRKDATVSNPNFINSIMNQPS